MGLIIFRSPKTGGTAFCDAFRRSNLKVIEVIARQRDRLKRFDWFMREGADVCIVYASVIHPILHRYDLADLKRRHRIVGIVRNPYAKYISAWRYMVKEGWCPRGVSPEVPFGMRGKIQKWGQFHCFRSQLRSLYCIRTGELIVHDVMRQEKLQADMNVLCEDVGIKVPCMMRKNATKHEPWPVYYKKYKKLRGLVEEYFAPEIRILPYDFSTEVPDVFSSLPKQIEVPYDSGWRT